MTHIPLEQIQAPLRGHIPTDDECRTWWDSHQMLEHIKNHSALVAEIATELAQMAVRLGRGNGTSLPDPTFIQMVRASALLHDLAKTYTIQHGGNHSQVGAAWVMELTGNPLIAQGVMHHVHWPGPLDFDAHFLPMAVLYADKRVKHDTLVSMEDRYADLMDRYGKNERSRGWIHNSKVHCLEIEKHLSAFLGENIHAYSFNCGRLVR